MSHDESPIHPLLSTLIDDYKKFSTIEFPRGRPEPLDAWRSLLQAITKAEAQCIPQIHNYLNGESADLNLATPGAQLKSDLTHFPTKSPADANYLKLLQSYFAKLDQLALALKACATTLGNPCQTYRSHTANQKDDA